MTMTLDYIFLKTLYWVGSVPALREQIINLH